METTPQTELATQALPIKGGKRAKPGWVPQAGSQELFLGSHQIFEVLYGGTRGPGKTDALLMSFAMHVGKGYGGHWRGIIFRRTYPELKDIINKSKRWFNVLFPGAEYNESKNCWTWPSGEQLYFAHMRVPDDYWSYHGHEYPFIGWEELTTWADDACYRRMMSCCRSSGPHDDMPRMYRATTNPYGPGHTWVKRRFQLPQRMFEVFQDDKGSVDPQTGKTYASKPRLYIHGVLSENKILLKQDPDYMNTLRESARNEQELKAWVQGSWDVVSGGMFSDVFNEKYHVVKPFPIPESWRVDRAFDWGGTKPFSLGWYAESDGTPYECPETGKLFGTVAGDIFRLGEWYGTSGKSNEGLGLTATEFASQAQEKEEFLQIHKRCKPGPADHNIFARDRGPSMHDEYRKFRIRFEKADKGQFSRQRGWDMIRNRFKHALPREDGQPRELPGLYIFDRCRYFLELVPSLPRSDKDPDDIDTDSEDHIADELRYRIRRVKKSMQRGTF